MNEVAQEVDRDQLFDQMESVMAEMEQVECKVVNRFTDGMYIRECHIPAGTILTSMTHKTEHPFVISKGSIMVTSDNEGSIVYEAPYTGITKPHTRRALHAITDVIWTTFHATKETDLDKICEELLEDKDTKHIEEKSKGFTLQYKK
jgi:hypothetical protein